MLMLTAPLGLASERISHDCVNGSSSERAVLFQLWFFKVQFLLKLVFSVFFQSYSESFSCFQLLLILFFNYSYSYVRVRHYATRSKCYSIGGCILHM